MGRQGRPSPSPGGAELGGGADDGMVMHWGGVPSHSNRPES